MKGKKLTALILLSLILIISLDYSFAGSYFLDVFGHWAEEEIMWGTNNVELFTGYKDGTFRPDNNITRSEFISILFRTAVNQGIDEKLQMDILGTSFIDEEEKKIEDNKNINEDLTQDTKILEIESEPIYKDLDKKFWAYNDIVAVKDYIDNLNKDIKFRDIFSGNKFYPNKYITREEAALLSYFYTSPPISNNNKQFNDLDTSYKYYNIIEYLVDNNIITGYEDNTFKPNNNITRGESAAIIRRIYMNMKYLKKDYLDDIYLISNEYFDSTPLFGDYDKKEMSNDDYLFKKAVTSLGDLEFVGSITYEEKHMYDLEPLKTLNSLKEDGYWNILGADYYILKYGKLGYEEKAIIYKELLEKYMGRDDIKDFESFLIFNEGLSLKCDFESMLPAVEKWQNNSINKESKYNAVFIMSKILIDSDRVEEALVLYKENIIDESLNIRFHYIINKAYVLMNINELDDAKNLLQEGWNALKQDSEYYIYREKYDDIFIGSIKKIVALSFAKEVSLLCLI